MMGDGWEFDCCGVSEQVQTAAMSRQVKGMELLVVECEVVVGLLGGWFS
jgi:hypothetical protein